MSYNLFPQGFIQSLAHAPGFDEQSFINIHQENSAPVSVRINPAKPTALNHTQQVQWCRDAFYLDSRPSFTFDPLFHAGCYYVQEASSMFLDHVFRHIYKYNEEQVKVLDLCAAPGGKSTLISSVITDNDLLVANEIIKTRVPVLADNLTRWGKPNVVVTNNDPKAFSRLKSFFDIIVVDAPCSGSGMFRKDAAAMEEWSAANVSLCQQRQERILADVYPALKEDGYFIYSTCSYSYEEDEAVIDWLCTEFELESIRIPLQQDWGIVESQSEQHQAWGYRFYPDKVKGEGLYMACLRKKENSGYLPSQKIKPQQKPDFKLMEFVKPYVQDAAYLFFFNHHDDWLAINRTHRDSLAILQQYLYIKKAGVRLGKLAGKELIPDHELALSTIINKDNVMETELSYDQAIAYLRRENFAVDTEAKGWSLMNYQGHALGWAKLLPNRINNYYPKEMRILAPRPPEGGAKA